MPDNPNLRVEAYTVEFWFKPDRPQDTAAVIGRKRHFSVYLNSVGSVSFRFYPSNNWNFRTLKTASELIQWGEWNHLAVTSDRSTAKIYLNGNLAAERETGGYSTPEPAPLYLAREADKSRGNYFQGQLAEVRIWNFARSEEAIKKDIHSSLGGNEPGLVGCWSLQQDSSNLVSEESEIARSAIVHGATWQQLEGPFEDTQSLLVFDGEDDYLSVADNPHLRVQTYTAEVWIKPEKAAEPAWKGIIGKWGWGFQFWLTRVGRIRHFFYVEPSESKVIDTPNRSIKWDRWNHAAITNDGTTAKTYINGNLIAEMETGGTLCVDEQPLYLGCSFEKRKGNFKGIITEARLWNFARSQEEIQQSMNSPLEGSESGLVGYWPLSENSANIVPETDEVANYAIFRGASWQKSNLPLP